ncbi:hypothetical protein TIFTF001_016360 [Ficus carica]|uniref:Transposase-associated domain-containing protein n=1 Tax=Ficus carica TaxID=3494 RepID=A0AA88DIU1_FICCA|nr:hypothetical protein TIFTF001_016360 [Ficus carica]
MLEDYVCFKFKFKFKKILKPSLDAEVLCFNIPRIVRDLANLNFLWNARIWYVRCLQLYLVDHGDDEASEGRCGISLRRFSANSLNYELVDAMEMDKSWIFIKNRLFSKEYRDGVDHFIAKANDHLNEEYMTRCPCVKCLNHQFRDLVTVKRHILEYGFSGHYVNWNFHGEEDINLSYNFQTVESDVGEDDDDEDDKSEDAMAEALRDAAGPSGEQ